jgi:peptide/nickel transport system substrate-binding protein
VQRDREQRIVPMLATGWQVVNDITWRFTIRRDARFHDGTPATVVLDRTLAAAHVADGRVYAPARQGNGHRRADDRTAAGSTQSDPAREHAQSVYVMSRAWCVAHHVERVPDFKLREEAFSTLNAIGSGPFVLGLREPGIRTVLARNPA